MEKKTTVSFVLREDYYKYGRNDAKGGVFDTVYVDRTEDARLSYLAGWSSVPAGDRANNERLVII